MVTVPAYFNDSQRQATKVGGRRGIGVRRGCEQAHSPAGQRMAPVTRAPPAGAAFIKLAALPAYSALRGSVLLARARFHLHAYRPFLPPARCPVNVPSLGLPPARPPRRTPA